MFATNNILRTIWIDSETKRTFHVGEIVDFYIGTTAHKAQIVSFEGGLFHFRFRARFRAGGEVHKALGTVFAKALKPARIPTEQLNRGW